MSEKKKKKGEKVTKESSSKKKASKPAAEVSPVSVAAAPTAPQGSLDFEAGVVFNRSLLYFL